MLDVSKFGIAFFICFLISKAIPALGQDTSRSAVVTKDSVYHYPKESLETDMIYPPKHREKGFLKRDIALGGSLGTPGGLNVFAEGYYDHFGLRFEGGAMLLVLAVSAGWQADLSYVLARGRDYIVECSAIYYKGGLWGVDDGWSTYYGLGAGIGLTAGPLFLQLGIGHTGSKHQYTVVSANKILINGMPMSGQIGLILPLHLDPLY